jgi:CDP-diacylglycerol--glycerol-3-phosphate 3-phosphatidyltransferase
MISIYSLKPQFQRLVRGAAGNWMTPDMAIGLGVVTASAVGLCFALGLAVQRWFLLAVPPLLFARMGFNALDGMLAREKNLADRRGEVLNEISDVGGDCLSYLPAALFAPAEAVCTLVLTIVIATLLAEFTGILGKATTGTRRYDGPLGGKSDRAFWFATGALAAAFFPSAVADYGPYYLVVVLVFVLLTWLNRLRLLWKSV